MSVAIHRLGDGARATVTAHFLALPMKDRRLRFGTSLAPRVIAAYVDRIDFDRDAVFGVHDDRLVRLKPQNLVTGLPIRHLEAVG